MRNGIRLFSLVLPAVMALGWVTSVPAQSAPTGDKAAPAETKAAPAAPQVPEEMQQKAKTYKGSAVPPRGLKQVGEGHWTPYDPPANATGPDWYVIQKGDTLSMLAQQKLGTWMLWPQIWDQNTYIKDAHWIYPGDPLLITRPQVVSEATPLEPEALAETKPEPAPVQGGMTIEAESPQPPINFADVYCSGAITKTFAMPHLTILASQRSETAGWAKGDVVYLNEGKAEGHQAGDKLTVLRVGQVVSHPVTGRQIGTYVKRTGVVKILAVQEHTSIAEIVESCDEIYVGNVLVPWRPIPIPWDVKRSQSLPLQLDDMASKPMGRVVWSEYRLEVTGESSIIYIDMGSKQRLIPGDKIWFFRYPAAQGSLTQTTNDLFRQQKLDAGPKDLFRQRKVGTGKTGTDPRTQADVAEASSVEQATQPSTLKLPETSTPPGPGVKAIPMFIGEGVVLTTEPDTACVKVITSAVEIFYGDWVMTE
jgi:hypothetical protein